MRQLLLLVSYVLFRDLLRYKILIISCVKMYYSFAIKVHIDIFYNFSLVDRFERRMIFSGLHHIISPLAYTFILQHPVLR